MAVRAAVNWRRVLDATPTRSICSRPLLSTVRHRAYAMSDDGMNIDDGMFYDYFIIALYSLPISRWGREEEGSGFPECGRYALVASVPGEHLALSYAHTCLQGTRVLSPLSRSLIG